MIKKHDLDYYKNFLKTYFKKISMYKPDLTVHRGDKEEYCAGYIAKIFEELGGEAIYYGKPYKKYMKCVLKKRKSFSNRR